MLSRDAVKAARTVLNGGDEETYLKATRLVPTMKASCRLCTTQNSCRDGATSLGTVRYVDL